ncbi:hypothetical protein [Flavobacterium succinicans]|uniref:Uncharacterized protein n=1 Tax=Flavobacterium succinicans TaxID=29536 RepID=A0A199XPR3_9FLAO|nr:hypothetical protein [Flavobacterium succinicans]OAZ03407.1 hypothetical protein FLB_21960 [Flavobacterium succinicans]
MSKFYFILLFFSFTCFSAENPNSFIVNKDGEQISINSNFFRIDNTEKCIYYKLVNSPAEIKMNFNDLDYVMIRKNKFKTVKFANTKELKGFFVLSESATKTLLFSSMSSEEEESVVKYEFYIIDKSGSIVESHVFDNLKRPKSASTRSDIFGKIRFFFDDCPQLIKRISSFDVNSAENFNLDILGFFDEPIYINCL